MSTSALEQKSAVEEQLPPASKGSAANVLLVISVFAISMAVSLGFDLTSSHSHANLAHDGDHYFHTCRSITDFLLKLIHGRPDFGSLFNEPFREQLLLDGPVVPGIPALVFTVLGHLPLATGWRIFSGVYCFMEAVSACLVAVLTLRFTGSRMAALIAGIAFGILPSTIVATGRFCSEVPATLFLLAFVACLSGAQERPWRVIGAGVFAGLVAMVKAVLLPIVGLGVALTVLRSPRKWLLSSLLIVAMTVTVLPWAAYTKATTGKASITVQRWPALNASVATDLETDGWECMPPSVYMEYMMSSNDALSALTGPWISRPGDLLKLSVRRYTRLFAVPWNTFRAPVFGITPDMQVYIHNFLLLLGTFGMAVYFLSGRRRLSSGQKLVGDLCLALVVVHFSFSVLQALARYTFTAIPVFVVFAGYGVSQLIGGSARREMGGRVALAASVIALLFVASVQGAEPLTRLNESHEVTYSLRAGESVEKRISIPTTHYVAPPVAAFVLVDANKWITGSDLKVNGHVVPDRLRSLAQYHTWLYLNYATVTQQTELLDISEEDLRQWRVVPIPISWINSQGQNDIVLISHDSAQVYADSDARTRHMLSPRHFAHDKMFNTFTGYEARVEDAIACPRAEQASAIVRNGGVSQPLSGSLRIKLALVCENGAGPPPVSDGSREFVSRVGPQDFNEMLRDGDSIDINPYILKFAPYTFATVKFPEMAKGSHLKIEVKGMVRTDRPGGVVGIPVSILTSKNQDLVLGKCPNYIKATQEWEPFAIEDLVPQNVFDGTPVKLKLALFPCHWQQAWYGSGSDGAASQLKDITVKIESPELPMLSGSRTLIY